MGWLDNATALVFGSATDPTGGLMSGNSRHFNAVGDAIGFGPQSYAQKKQYRDAWGAQQERNQRFDALYGQYMQGGYDPKVAQDYYNAGAGQIRQGTAQAGLNVAADYDRHGFHRNAANTATQGQLLANQGTALGQLDAQSRSQARADHRLDLAGAMNAASAGSQAGMSMLQIAAQQAANVDQQRQAAMQSYLQLLGSAAGFGGRMAMGGGGMSMPGAAPAAPAAPAPAGGGASGFYGGSAPGYYGPGGAYIPQSPTFQQG